MRRKVLIGHFVVLLPLLQGNLLPDYAVMVPLLEVVFDNLLTINGLLLPLCLGEGHHLVQRALVYLGSFTLGEFLAETRSEHLVDHESGALCLLSQRLDLLLEYVGRGDGRMLWLIFHVLHFFGEISRFLNLTDAAAFIEQSLMPLFLGLKLAATRRCHGES